MTDESVIHNVKPNQFMPPLATFDHASLREDIARRGVLVPVMVNAATGEIIDGHHRAAIADELGIDYPIQAVDIADQDEAEIIAVALNVKRRRMSPDQRRELANVFRVKSGWSQQKIADALGVSRRTIGDWLNEALEDPNITDGRTAIRYIPRADTKINPLEYPAIWDRAQRGEKQIDIAADYGTTQPAISLVLKKYGQRLANQRAKKEAALMAPPEGEYRTIVIDPPWDMHKVEREVRPNQDGDKDGFDYPTMSEAELAAFRLPAAEDCHLFCWTTQKYLPVTLRLFDAWGFRYVLTMVWHKPGGFQPIGLPQFNCEFAVYGRKGSPVFLDTKSFDVCFSAPRGAHSAKPSEFYEVVRRVTGGESADGTRIDIFGRRDIPGFASWGNEASKNG